MNIISIIKKQQFKFIKNQKIKTQLVNNTLSYQLIEFFRLSPNFQWGIL